MRIDEAKALATAIAQTGFRETIFQPGSDLAGPVALVVKVELSHALQILFNVSDGESVLRQSYVAHTVEPCQQRIGTLVDAHAVDPYQGMLSVCIIVAEQTVGFLLSLVCLGHLADGLCDVVGVKNKRRRLHVRKRLHRQDMVLVILPAVACCHEQHHQWQQCL